MTQQAAKAGSASVAKAETSLRMAFLPGTQWRHPECRSRHWPDAAVEATVCDAASVGTRISPARPGFGQCASPDATVVARLRGEHPQWCAEATRLRLDHRCESWLKLN